ncbi:MAG: DUF4373 domain-containing protein [Candidatus Marinimicrobia bacterium]|nr:DUF4373 domain-containing protein [Candidatus Neomarinimicrobiota bacterium]
MARPPKRTVDYFPHFVHHKKTLFILEETFGNDGYVFWFKLLELLGASDGHSYDLRAGAEQKYLSAYTRLSEEKIIEILDMLSTLGAIDKELWEGKIIWCQKFVDNIADAYKNRVNGIPSKPNLEGHTSHINTLETSFNDVSSYENSQIKENDKITKSKKNELFDKFWDVYPRKNGKKKALQVWEILKPTEELTERIIKDLNQRKKTWDWKEYEGKFIPNPAKYLEEERWTDEMGGINPPSSSSGSDRGPYMEDEEDD